MALQQIRAIKLVSWFIILFNSLPSPLHRAPIAEMSYYHILLVLSDKSRDFIAVVRDAEIELYGKFAIASLLVYHTVTTLDTEAKYFWKIPRRPVDFIYFLNRYAGIVSIFISIQLHRLNVPQERSITWIHSILDWCTVLLVDYIIAIRVLALYSQDALLSLVLKIMLVIEASIRLACMIIAVVAEVELQDLHTPATACVEQNRCSQITVETIYWVTPAIYQIVLAFLACYKAAEYWRMSAGFKGFTLVKVLVVDQIVYFGLVILISIINILKCHIQDSIMLSGMATVLGSPGLLCLVCSIMVVNLKEAGERGQNEGTSYRSTVTSMEFADVCAVRSSLSVKDPSTDESALDISTGRSSISADGRDVQKGYNLGGPASSVNFTRCIEHQKNYQDPSCKCYPNLKLSCSV